MLNYVVHLVGACLFSFGVFYDYTYVIVPTTVVPIMSAYGGKFKFLTFWDAILQALYFILCLVIDVVGWERQKGGSSIWICALRDYIFTVFAFPVALFVSATFWGLYAVDRELVLPKVLDPYFPVWLNHIMHTFITVFAIFEMLTSYRAYTTKTKGLIGLLLFQLTYLSWMHFVYYKSGLWVYNVFNVLNIPQRIAFLVVSILTGFFFYFVGENLNSMIWPNEESHGTLRQLLKSQWQNI